MPRFGKRSKKRLATCDDRLQDLFKEVIKYFDCTVIQGHRGEAEQNQAYDAGRSKLRYPDGKHNADPSKAVDVAPYPIDWSDRDRFHYFGGFVLGIASQMGLKIRWGGDWDRDTEVKDNRFDDLPHFEIRE
jgi:peptidoglycan L-alanyl-D-glutamate endopeptidase CwlK|tara:strand:+ start:5270 stop:5662 length:393 start_codon:yes stop_codon:yes gene_type:complete